MLSIQLLGGFKITADGQVISQLTRPRGQSLLAYLALTNGTPQARSHLASVFWPDSGEHQARTNLRRELYLLRKAFPQFDNLMLSDTQSVRWIAPPQYSLDVNDFLSHLRGASQEAELSDRIEQLQAAVELYRGDLLPGMYDDWILARREELRQSFIQALESLVRQLVGDRDYATAVGLVQRLLQYDPLFESGYAQLMELYALQNDRARALHTYHTCASTLERELGVAPSEDVESIYQRLLQKSDGEQKQRAVKSSSVPLVGRKAEWQTVLAAWRQASRGSAHMTLIEGEAGIGKTRLAEELLDWANRQGIAILRARCYAAEGSFSFTPVVEWIRAEFTRGTIAGLDPVWRTEIARLMPELLSDSSGLSAPQPLTESWQRRRFYEALARAITSDTMPKLLLLDDLQWCDRETFEWLRFLFRFAPESPLHVLGAIRSEEVSLDHPIHTLTHELRTGGQFSTVELFALSSTETKELATEVSGQALVDAAADLLYGASEGNPLFVVEMVRAGYHERMTGDNNELTFERSLATSETLLPPKVRAVIQARLAQLSAPARQLAAAAATIGRSFSFDVLTAASDLTVESTVSALDELWRRRIIRERGVNQYDFSHDRIRDVAYTEISPVLQRRLHALAATALEKVYRDDLDSVSAQIAVQHEQAGELEKALPWHQRSAEVAHRLYAMPESLIHVEAALRILADLPETKPRVQQKLALLLLRSRAYVVLEGFASVKAREVSAQIRDIALKIDAKSELFYALLRIGNVNVAGGGVKQGLIIAEDVAKIAKPLSEPMYHVEAQWLVGRAHLHMGQLAAASTNISDAINSYDIHAYMPEKPDAQSLLMGYQALILWLMGYPTQAQQLLTRAITIAEQQDDPFETLKTYFIGRVMHRQLSNRAAVISLTERGSKIIDLYDLSFQKIDENIMIGWTLAKHPLAESIELVSAMIDQLKKMGYTMFITQRMEILSGLYLKAKRPDAALLVLDEALAISERCNESIWDAELYRMKGRALQAQSAPTVQVEICYQLAIDTARQQQAKSLELRATLDLCHLNRQNSTGEASLQNLADLYNWFTEGFNTPDLQTAKGLLAR